MLSDFLINYKKIISDFLINYKKIISDFLINYKKNNFRFFDKL